MWSLALLGSLIMAGTVTYTLLPGSTSPDGKAALCYRQLASEYPSDHPGEFYFCDPKTLSLLSVQLADNKDSISDSAMLYESIGEDAEAQRTGRPRDPAFHYKVVWDEDSQRVKISGGEHKFWAAFAYHRHGSRFERLDLPRARLPYTD